MGVFPRYALFPGCDGTDARTVETAVKAIGFPMDIRAAGMRGRAALSQRR